MATRGRGQMTFRFIHIADVHLGYRQYGSDERYNDFFGAFQQAVNRALECDVDFVLIAGDLFHKRALDAETFSRAATILMDLADMSIPVIAIEGNHERRYYSENMGWLDTLAALGLLIVLHCPYEDGKLLYKQWDGVSGEGAYYDLHARKEAPWVRIVGLQYCGAASPRVVRDLARAMAETPGEEGREMVTILMLHAGLPGMLDHYSGALRMHDLEALRPHVDYLALGHVHKEYQAERWIHNPGSLAANSIEEADWDRRGFFIVRWDPGMGFGVTRESVIARAFVRVVQSVDGVETPKALLEAIQILLDSAPEPVSQTGGRPVVEVRLTGTLAFDRALLPRDLIRGMVLRGLDAIVVRLKDETVDVEVEFDPRALGRRAVEKEVFDALVARDAERAKRPAKWLKLLWSLQFAAVTGDEARAVEQLREFCAKEGVR